MSRLGPAAPLLLLLGLLASSGCAVDRIAADHMLPVMKRVDDSFERSRTPKAARAAAPGLLFTLDGVIETTPENPGLLELAAQMYATFSFGFVEDEDEEWAKELYDKAFAYAKRALEIRDHDLAKLVETPLDQNPKLPAIDRDSVPALFWLAFAWGSRINLDRSNEKLVGQVGQVDRAMQAVLEADETFFYGGPHLYFAIRYASLGASMGGNPKKALEHFEAVDRLTQNRHLMAKTLRAKFYSCSLMEKDQKGAWNDFLTTLEGVVNAKEDLWPEQRLANEVAKVKAKKLLAHPSDAQIDPPEGVTNPYAPDK
jgi:tetratricopeptide (TPR) repeat protein